MDLVDWEVDFVLEQAVVLFFEDLVARVAVAVDVRVVAFLVHTAAAFSDACFAATPVEHGLVGAAYPPAEWLPWVVQEPSAKAFYANVL